jgi:hypothetical protein
MTTELDSQRTEGRYANSYSSISPALVQTYLVNGRRMRDEAIGRYIASACRGLSRRVRSVAMLASLRGRSLQANLFSMHAPSKGR